MATPSHATVRRDLYAVCLDGGYNAHSQHRSFSAARLACQRAGRYAEVYVWVSTSGPHGHWWACDEAGEPIPDPVQD